MTNSPNPTPPSRRRRLTADELIAILVALTGIGTVFFWGIGQQNGSMNLFQRGIAGLGSDNANRQGGLLNSGDTSSGQERKTIASVAQRDRQNATTTTTTTTTNSVPTTIVKTVEVPAEATAPAPAPAPAAVAPAVVPVLPVVKAPTFKDVPKQLQKRGILDDFGTAKFDPTKPITRGEYAKMLDRAFADKPVTAATTNFKDIPANYTRKEALDKSVQLGFMTGYPAQKFAPNQSIPRYQLQISLAKGLQLPAATNTEQVLSKYTDAKEMPKYARDKMAAAIDAGLVIKDNTTDRLKPVQTATRADAAALIYEVLVKEGKIKPQQ
jgi:S-layer homology domain